MIVPAFNCDSRLMIFAPHPDDESLACSIPLQRAIRAHASVRVVYATDGEDNPWPQRLLERKWRLNATDRRRWGKLRRAEALAALRALGLQPSSARFLALPDQSLTSLLTRDCESVLGHFRNDHRRVGANRPSGAFNYRYPSRPQCAGRDASARLRRASCKRTAPVDLQLCRARS